MQQAFYNEKKHMTIYALVNRAEGPYVYVGKTSSPRISAVYSHHRCGDIAATSGYCDLPEEVPELYILERIWATGAVAYRHTLAWLRYFLDEGYYAVNHEGTELHARTLQTETEAIYLEIRKKPLKTILDQTYIARPADANLPSEKKPQFFRQEEKTVQMNVRINRSDKLRFDKYCRSRGLNQRQGFALLLENEGEGRIYREQAKKIERLETERDKLRRKVEDLEGHGPKEDSAQAHLTFLISGLKRYFEAVRPTRTSGNPVPRMTLAEFKRENLDEWQYRYPEEEGFYQVLPVAVAWGKRQACFVLCRGENGEKYRLRTYPRKAYVGCSFRQPLPVGLGTPWLVGIRRAKGGIMDILAAFPLDMPTPDEVHTASEKPAKAPLGDQIRQAQSRTV